ncbi:MAG: acetolactate decarboxylase [Fibrobacter sp.]|nr:acetolactate decarboxylase [Fibrobacter sp.]
MYQVSTLNALSLGYTRKVVSIEELLRHGDTGLGTFQDIDGEMIVIDGHCYRATDDGSVNEPPADFGVPFASVAKLEGIRHFDLQNVDSIDTLKTKLNLKIEEDFGLNSMHLVRIDAEFQKVHARSESARHTQHVELKELLKGNQKNFCFEKISGSIVCLYYPDYMQGINAAGWHFHFVSDDRTCGGHVFEIAFQKGFARHDKISHIEMQLPTEASFDTYSLTAASNKDIKQVEQGKK